MSMTFDRITVDQGRGARPLLRQPAAPPPVAVNLSGRDILYPGGYTLPMTTTEPFVTIDEPVDRERKGRRWLIWSFLLCPCHLPLTLGVLGAVLGATGLGAVLKGHAVVAGVLISAAWMGGTGYGLHLIRQAEKADGAACPLPQR